MAGFPERNNIITSLLYLLRFLTSYDVNDSGITFPKAPWLTRITAVVTSIGYTNLQLLLRHVLGSSFHNESKPRIIDDVSVETIDDGHRVELLPISSFTREFDVRS